MTDAIRLATPDDIAALDALLASSYGRQLAAAYPPSLLVMAVPLLARAQPALIASGRYHVIERGGRIVGAGGWSRRAPGRGGVDAPGLGHVRHVVTDARLARQGIGRRLLSHVFQEARAEGVTRLDCLATLNAEAFYAVLGFERLGPVTIPLAPGIDFPAVRMVKTLG